MIKRGILNKAINVFFMSILALVTLNSCATGIQHITKKGVYDAVMEKPICQTRVYKYSYDVVYEAITSMLEKRLGYGVSRLYTANDIIYSNYLEAPPRGGCGFAYAYLFILKKLDDTHTEVSLKASGGVGSISDKDMLDRYLMEELKYAGNK